MPDESQKSSAAVDGDLRHGVILTEISRATASLMVLAFGVILLGIPAFQIISDLNAGRSSPFIELIGVQQVPTTADLRRCEESLQDRSLPLQYARPRMQEMMSKWGGFGSATVVIGRDGWLFYRPGIDSITGPGFLDEDSLLRRVGTAHAADIRDPISPDPRPAILQFKRQVEAAGAHLILVPIPDKASLQAEMLGLGRLPSTPLANVSYRRLLSELRAAGVEVFDPSPAAVRPGEVRYLTHDTHWTPQWMDEVAASLARRIGSTTRPPSPAMRAVPATATADGDLVEALRLTDEQGTFPRQTVLLSRIIDTTTDRPIRPDARSDVLLLGDSFTNIYSAGPMGWGDGAGLAEHISHHLQRRVDWIARNDAGAHATRMMLRQQRDLGHDRLSGKRFVIWQVAARELSLGNWRIID